MTGHLERAKNDRSFFAAKSKAKLVNAVVKNKKEQAQTALEGLGKYGQVIPLQKIHKEER
jgi:hypothetical protein